MNKLGRLIKNELLKKIKQPSTIVLAAIFIVFSFIVPFFMASTNTSEEWYLDNQLDWEIQTLNQNLNAIGNDVPDYAKGQYKNSIEFFEKAQEYGLEKSDWRYNMLFSVYEQVKANYIYGLVLDDTIDPNDENETKYLENFSSLFYPGQEIDKDQIRAIYNSNKAQIDSIWQVIENNDYKYYCQKQIESYDISISMTEQQIVELKNLLEAKPYDYQLKYNLLNEELSLEETKSQKELTEYRITAEIPFDKEWRDQTIKKISENIIAISSIRRQLFDYQNGKDQFHYNEYGGLSLNERITAAEKKLVDYEDRNKINWYSLENDIPHFRNVKDSRSVAMQYFSMTMFAAIIALFIASNIVSGEFSTKTINMLIIRPVKRWKIITAKFIAVLIFSYVIYLVGMVVNLISVGIIFGFDALSIPYLFVSGDTVHSIGFILYMLKNMLFCSINIVFLVTLVFMMSTLTKNTALSAISGMGLYFLSTIVYQILLFVASVPIGILKYTILPYFDLQNFIIKRDYVEEINYLLLPEFGAVLFLVLSAVMFTVSLIVFNKRDVK